jgi:acyl-ACP thioesterase
MDSDWPGRPAAGRVFEASRKVRLADTGPDGTVRLDAIARYLQDIATDDSDDAGFSTGPGTGHIWVVRQAAIRLVPGAEWPQLGELVRLATWCGGLGRAWAIRRTALSTARGAVETSALWVHLDDRGRPARLDERFLATYREAAGGRSASTRVGAPGPPAPGAMSMPWVIRASDIDIVGHVNNAAVWAAVVEAAAIGGQLSRVRSADLVHHGALESGERAYLWLEEEDDGRLVSLTVDDEVRVGGRLAFQPSAS